MIATPPAALDDLRRRLRATRWPEPAPVDGWAQGVPLDYLRDLVAYWADGYDWRATQARVNQIEQHRISVDGLEIHVLHRRSAWHPAGDPHARLARIILRVRGRVEPLAAAGFDVVVPSLPGYGFSAQPTEPGWDIHRIARAWAELMTALGYPRFIAAGNDWGTSVSTSLALQVPERLLGIHLVPPLVAPIRTDLTPAEAKALDDLADRERTAPATRPCTPRGRRRSAIPLWTPPPACARGSSRRSGPGPTTTATWPRCSPATRSSTTSRSTG